jgi:hypothetical protein
MEKIGPMSLIKPWSERKESLLQYWKQSCDPDSHALIQAMDSVKSILSKRSLRAASFSTAFKMMPSDTSLGAPWFSRDRKFVGDYYERATQMQYPDDLYPCYILVRGQSAGRTETKNRNVWAFDHSETILGATILYPLLNALKQHEGFAAWVGAWAVDAEATRLLSKAQGRRILSSDYSGFDASVSRLLLDAADDIMKYWFEDSVGGRIDLLGEIFATVPIIVPGEILDGRNGGVPSGSVLTNMKDTLVNLLAGFYYAFRSGTKVEDFMVLGDDSVFLYADDIIDRVPELANELGLDANPDKQFVSDKSLHYLQRWHSLDYMPDGIAKGVHSPYRSISGMLHYERWRKYDENTKKHFDSTRWIMQSENCNNHPFFETRWVPFWYDGDSNLKSGIDPMTAMRLAGGSDKIRSVLNIASFPFNQKDPDRLNEFDTVRVIRELQRGVS